jgi:hypothetical protein
MADDTTAQPLTPRRRQRPYLNWLERSRDNWKSHAVKARAEVCALRRQVRSLTASRDRWRSATRDLRRQCCQLRQEQEKNVLWS